MLSSASVGTDDLDRSIAFYDEVLCVLGMERLMKDGSEAGYGAPGGSPVFYVNLPYDRGTASFGNGVQISFSASDRETVNRFHAKVLELGGTDEGAPGERAYSPGYYGAYCRDEYGNKLHVAHTPG